MKIRSLILIGLFAGLCFAIALLPASLVWRVAGSGLALPVVVDRVGGTVWDGFLVGRVSEPAVRGPIVIRWDLQGLRLLTGEAALEMGVEGQQYRLQGVGFWGLWGKGLRGFNGDVRAAMLEQALAEFGVSAQGMLKLADVSVRLSGNRVSSAQGVVSWSGGKVAVKNAGSRENIEFPGVRGELNEIDGNLIVAVTETQGHKPLGELSLLPEQGLAGVKVLKRVMALAGFGAQGDEDKVLVSLQQPLPF